VIKLDPATLLLIFGAKFFSNFVFAEGRRAADPSPQRQDGRVLLNRAIVFSAER